MLTLNRPAIISVAALTLTLAACAANEIMASLEATVDATEAAFPAVAAETKLSPETTALIMAYLADVNKAALASAPILADTTTTPAEKGMAIEAAFAAVLSPNLPAGTPQTVAAVVGAVAGAVQVFLGQIQTASAKIQFTHPEFTNAFRGKAAAPKPKKGDLDRIVKKAAHNLLVATKKGKA
jgi:hypothetical protein